MDQDLDPQLAIEQALAHLGDDDSSDSQERGRERGSGYNRERKRDPFHREGICAVRNRV